LDIGVLPGGKATRTEIKHLHLAPRLRMRGAIPLLQLCVSRR